MLDRCRPFFLLALFLPVLAGAYDDGCIITVQPIEPGKCERACEEGAADDERCSCTEPGVCEYDGVIYEEGASFSSSDGCNECRCRADGEVICTLRACEPPPCDDPNGLCDPVCEYEGKFYRPGESFPASDGCNQCYCDENGWVGCTEMACEEPPPCDDPSDPACGACVLDGVVYEEGETFPSPDGCNSCSCWDGLVLCTAMACEEPPPEGPCDGPVYCDALPPECPAGFVPSVAGGCWGDCIPEELCSDERF